MGYRGLILVLVLSGSLFPLGGSLRAQPDSLRETTAAVGDRVNFRGRVCERGTNAPIARATVLLSFPDAASDSTLAPPWKTWRDLLGRFPGQQLVGERLVTGTDDDGRFAFRALPPGAVEVSIASPGCQPFSARERIGRDELVKAEYRLTHVATGQYEIVVYGRRDEKEVTRERLDVAEVEQLPGFGGDVIKSVQTLPGVARPSMSDPGNIVVRGSSQFDTRYVLDGIDVPLLFHYGGIKSTYNSLALSSVDLFPGGFGTRYGGCTGGVIEVRGRAGRTDRWRTTVDASLLDASLHTEGPLGHGLSLLLTTRRSYAGELARAALRSQEDLNLTMAPYYADVVARVDHGAGTDAHSFLTAFGAKDRMELIFSDQDAGSPEINEATNAVDLDLSFSRFIIGDDRRLGASFHNELRGAYGEMTQNGHAFGYFDFRLHGPSWQVRDELAFRAGGALTLKAGCDLASWPLRYQVRVLGWPASRMDGEFSDLGGFASAELRPARGLLLVPGFRYDRYGHLDQGKPSVRFTARYEASPAHTVTAAFGTYNQPPQPMGQSTDPVYGNPDLPPTEATHYTAGDEWHINERTSVKIESYYNRQREIPALTDSLDLNFLPDAEGRMYGMELMLRREEGERFFGWVSYCLSRSERRYTRRPVAGGGQVSYGLPGATEAWDRSRWWPYEYDQTHHLEAMGSWKVGRNWTTGIRLQYTSGNPVTPLLNLDGRTEFDADTGEYRQVPGEYLSDRMDPYFRFDCRVEKKFPGRTSWSVYLDVQNLNYFLYNSPESYSYNYDFSRREAYGWIILPALGARVEF